MKYKLKSFRNSKGFSLLEVLVATGILAIVSTFGAVLVSSVQDLLFQTSRETRVDEVHANVTMTLADPVSCFNTFSVINYTGAAVAVPTITSAFATPKYVVGGNYYQTVTIQGMLAQNFVFGGGSDVPAPFTGRFDLVISYQFTTGGGAVRTVNRTVTVKTAPTAWAAGNALAANPIRCSGGAGVGFGFDIPTYLHRHIAAVPPDEIKTGNLTMNGGGVTMPANLEVIGLTTINTGLFQVSDKRLKTNLAPLALSFDQIDSINGYAFTWKKSDRPDHGFIAQEVEAQFPELVANDPKRNTKKMRYQNLVPILAESNRKLRHGNRDLETRIEALEKKIENKTKHLKR